MKLYSTLFLLCFLSVCYAQDPVFQTFKDTRVINSHSVETLQKRKLDIRIGHRFGDMFGDAGGWPTFYGLENSTDVSTGGEYGVTDRLTIGISRSKGGGSLRQLINPIVKYKIVQQRSKKSPFTITGLFISSITTMVSSDSPEALNNFKSFSHRVVYGVQAIVGRKFSDRFSFQLIPGIIHRNLAPLGESNNTVSVGAAFRIQATRVLGLIMDITYPISSTHTSANGYYPPIGIGFEFDTGGGHIFQLNFTNARGMMETGYIPYTTSNWAEGQFRMGFTISRLFNL